MLQTGVNASPLLATDPRHGTLNGYNNLGCRCEACRNAIAAYMREYNHRTGRKRPMAVYLAELSAKPPPPHGTEARYSSPHSCRCDLCRKASVEARKRRRHSNIEATRAYDRARWHDRKTAA